MYRTAVEDLIEKLCSNDPNRYDRAFFSRVVPTVSQQLNTLSSRIQVGKLNSKGTGSINVDKLDARAAVLLEYYLQKENEVGKQTYKSKYITENVVFLPKWDDLAKAVLLSAQKIDSLQQLQQYLLHYINAVEYNQPRRSTRTSTCFSSRIANAAKPNCDRPEKKDVCSLLTSNDAGNGTSDKFCAKKGNHQRKYAAASTGRSTFDSVRRDSCFKANSLLNPKWDVKNSLQKSTHAIRASVAIDKTTVTSRVDEFFEIALNICQSDETYLYRFAQHCEIIFQKIIGAFDDSIAGSLAAQQERLAHLEDIRRKESAYVAATFCIVYERVNDYGIATSSQGATDSATGSTNAGTYTDSDSDDHKKLFSFSKVIAASPSNVELDDLKQIHGHLNKLALPFESEMLKLKNTVGSNNTVDELPTVHTPPVSADISPTNNVLVNQPFLGEFPNKGRMSVSDKSRVDCFFLLAYKRCDIDHCPLYIAEQCDLLFQKICTFCNQAIIDYEETDKRSNLHLMDLHQIDATDLEAIYLVVVHRLTSEVDCSLSKFCDSLYGPLSHYFKEVYQTIFKIADRVCRTEMKSDTIRSLKLCNRTCKKLSRTRSNSWLSTVINGELRHIRLANDLYKIAIQCNTIFQNVLTYYIENKTYSLAEQVEQCSYLQDIRRNESSYIRAIFLVILEKERYSKYREGATSRLTYSLYDKVANISFDCSLDEFKTIYMRLKYFSTKMIHLDAADKKHRTGTTIGFYKLQSDFDASKLSNIEIGSYDRRQKRRSDLLICGIKNKKKRSSPMQSPIKKNLPQSCREDDLLPGELPKVDSTPMSAFNAHTRAVARNTCTLVLESAADSVFKKYCLK